MGQRNRIFWTKQFRRCLTKRFTYGRAFRKKKTKIINKEVDCNKQNGRRWNFTKKEKNCEMWRKAVGTLRKPDKFRKQLEKFSQMRKSRPENSCRARSFSSLRLTRPKCERDENNDTKLLWIRWTISNYK